MTVILAVALVSQAASAAFLDTVNALGGRLLTYQVSTGNAVWPNEQGYDGSTACGLVSAFQMTGDARYVTGARNAAFRIATDRLVRPHLDNEPAFYGDDVDLFVRLGSTPVDWKSVGASFFTSVRDTFGTEFYIGWFLVDTETDRSFAVFYLAHLTVAAYSVNDPDKAMWREGLIAALSEVDDKATFPVQALGIATWALAQTGKLDETPIAGDGAAAMWTGKQLKDLPAMLLAEQVPAGQLYAGSFFWRFDHGNGGLTGVRAAGYTEDSIFGTMGLAAISKADPNAVNTIAGLADGLAAARIALLRGVAADGTVKEHLWVGGLPRFVYCGEMLDVLGLLATAEDLKK
jgi:hypothetical protein